VLKTVENLWAVGAAPRTLLEKLIARPIAGGEGAAAPFLGTSTPRRTRVASAEFIIA